MTGSKESRKAARISLLAAERGKRDRWFWQWMFRTRSVAK